MKKYLLSILMLFLASGLPAILQGQTWTHYLTSPEAPLGVISHSAITSDGTLWFGSMYDSFDLTLPGRLSSFSNGELTTIDNILNVNDIVVDQNDVLWVATDSLLHRFDGEWTEIAHPEESSQILALALDPDGSIVILAFNFEFELHSLYRLDDSNWSFILGTQTGFDQIIIDDAGRMILSVFEEGLLMLDGPPISNFSNDTGLTLTSVSSLFIDNEQNLWVGSYDTSQPIASWNGSDWTYFQIATDGSGPGALRPRAIYQTPDGKIWSGGVDGIINIYDGNQWSSIDMPDELPLKEIASIISDDNGDVWIGHRTGISRLELEEEIVSSVSDLDTKSKLTVYPNPSSGSFEIASNGFDIAKWQLRDVFGRIQLTGNKSNTIHTSQLSLGTYLLSTFDKQGNRKTVEVIID